MTQAEIRHVRIEYHYGRSMPYAQLWAAGQQIHDGSIAELLVAAQQRGYVLSNAQQILEDVVLKWGFAR